MKKGKTTKVIFWLIIFVVLIVSGLLFIFPDGRFSSFLNLGLEYFVFYNILILILFVKIKLERLTVYKNVVLTLKRLLFHLCR